MQGYRQLRQEEDKHRGVTMKWINVKDRLPEKEDVRCIIKGGIEPYEWTSVAIHKNNKWLANSIGQGEITHWMPLPEPLITTNDNK